MGSNDLAYIDRQIGELREAGARLMLIDIHTSVITPALPPKTRVAELTDPGLAAINNLLATTYTQLVADNAFMMQALEKYAGCGCGECRQAVGSVLSAVKRRAEQRAAALAAPDWTLAVINSTQKGE